ncbi:MAG TPA: flagellar biosynthesis protein FlhF [Candidatus Hydrogenedentes bacterium]|nr:flagellar biosynthesis protein FlhF [Candidatus Hydrogenedentota bacterium]HOL76740.1 flagellar biosynthesis protein FlhF [Candidatus Hydrogenedentota bacterium]HPO85299.1 flagellar biosynthesis protein FlhF [Candidatus Hydrogenedentota bacterium]
MKQRLQIIRSDTLDEAWREMRRRYGPDAVVLRTTQVREGGWFGLFGKKKVELTVSCVEEKPEPARSKSVYEKEYLNVGVGSDERFQSTVSHFKNLVQPTPGSGSTEPCPEKPNPHFQGQTPVSGATTGVAVPFSKPKPAVQDAETLRRELQEVREKLDVLLAEAPVGGLPSEAIPYYRELVERGVSRRLAAALVMRVLRETTLRARGDKALFRTKMKLEAASRFRTTGGIVLAPGKCRVVALMGTTGVGKTTAIAKLAAHYAVVRRARVAFVTADTYRVAAPEQLNVYADIIGVPMKIADDPREVAMAIRAFRSYDLVLMDTAGGSMFNVRHLHELKAILGAAQTDERILVLTVGSTIDDLRAAVENYRSLQPTSLMFSKLDETRQLGVMYTIAVESGLPVSYLSVGQEVPDDIRTATPELLAALVIEGNARSGKASAESA